MMRDKVVDTIQDLHVRITAAGKHTGTLGVTVDQTVFWHERGIKWIVSSAPKFMQAGAANYLAGVKDPLGL
jgi:2-keto-3-deoxy-L-rhamnonate aldolase RhmA